MPQEHDNVETGAGEDASATFFEDLDLDIGDASMLLGTMRDHVLDGLRKPVGWPKLTEAQQHSINVAVEHGCKVALRGAFKVAAARSYPSMEMTIVDVKKTEKRIIEAKLRAPYDLTDWRRIGEATVCVLLPGASSEDYEGALPARVDKDQPDLMEAETEEDRKAREATAFEAAEREASIARARQFKPTDDATALGGEAAKLVGEMLPPKVKAAADRGRALRLDGGAFKIPADLEGKPSEVNAFQKAWEAADREAGATTAETDGSVEADATADPAKPPKGHRGKRTTAEERVAKRQAETADA